MAIEFEFKLDQLQAVTAALKRLTDAGTRLRPAMAEISGALLDSTRERFRSGTDPDGIPWAPISDRWKQRKLEQGGSPKILVFREYLSGLLREEFDDSSAGVSTHPLPYAAIHQFGSSKSSGRGSGIPARPFLGISDEDEAEILDVLSAHLDRAIGPAG